jgi:hypothetical protein
MRTRTSTTYINCKFRRSPRNSADAKTPDPNKIKRFRWWRWGDSNPRPLTCEASALPAELHPHGVALATWRIVRAGLGTCQSQMRRFSRAAAVALALVALIETNATARATTSAEVASNRCNSQTIDDASTRVRDYDRHRPGGSSTQLLQRYGAIVEVLAMLNEEREILDSICSSDAQRAPLFAQIAAFSAWGLALESDVAAKLNASCGAAAQALPAMMLADAWLALANVVNTEGGTVPPQFTDVIPKVQTRAQAVGLILPPWSESSTYWRDQVRTKAKAAIATCPSPSPSASPVTKGKLRTVRK